MTDQDTLDHDLRNLGLKWPEPMRLQNKIYGVALGLTGENMHPLDWHEVNLRLPDAGSWPRLERDEQALGFWPRGWRYGGALAIQHSVALSIEEKYPVVRPGVARVTSSGRVVVGMLPKGVRPGVYGRGANAHDVIIRRRGAHLEPITPAYINPETGRILTLERIARILDINIDLANLPAKFRGTPIV